MPDPGRGPAPVPGEGAEPSPAAARRAALAEAALSVMQREGYAAVTARKVAAEAGMSLGHITYHFKDMDSLMAEAYRLASARLLQAEARLAPDGPAGPAPARDRLAALLKAGFTDDILTPDYLRLRIDLWSAALTRPEVAATELDLYRAYRARLEGILTEMAHPSRQDRVAPVCDVVMATLDGLWLDWMRRRDHASVRRGLEMCQKLAALELG